MINKKYDDWKLESPPEDDKECPHCGLDNSTGDYCDNKCYKADML